MAPQVPAVDARPWLDRRLTLLRRPSRPPDAFIPALATIAFGLALLAESVLVLSGQWLSRRPWVAWTAWPLWLIAVAAYVVVVRAGGDDVDRRGGAGADTPAGDLVADADTAAMPASPRPRPSPAAALRVACAVVGLLGSAAAVALIQQIGDSTPARAYGWVLVLWCAAVAAYTLGLALPGAWLRRGGFVRAARRHRVALRDGVILLGIALCLRLFLLDRVPNILSGDEGVFGMAARWMSKGEGGHMFSTYWANATLYLVPHALLARVLPAGPLATRLPTAIASAFAAPATYALGRVVASRRVGLVAGLLIAVSHLHVHASRMGLGHGLDALWAAVAGAALIHAVRRRDVRTAAIAGLALGMAQYGYVGGRLVDAVALAFGVLSAAALAVQHAARSGRRRRSDRVDVPREAPPDAPSDSPPAAPPDRPPEGPPNGRSDARSSARWTGLRSTWAALGGGPLLVAAGGALVVAAPMVRWAIVRPNDYFSRLSAQGILQTGKWQEVADRVGDGRLAIALSQARDALYAIVAAPSYEFYFTPYPMLDVVWASLFGLGFAACVMRIGDRGRLWLVLQIALAWLTLALGAHASTATYRITGALPAMAVVAALALFALTDALWAGEANDGRAADEQGDDRGEAGTAPAGVGGTAGFGETGGFGEMAGVDAGGGRARFAAWSRAFGSHWVTPAGLVLGIVCFQLWAYWGVFAPGCGFFDRSTAAASVLGERVRDEGAGRAVFVLGRPWFDAGVFESVPYLSDRKVDIYDAVAPKGTRADADPALRTARIFDVPEGADLDVLVARMRDAAPALVFAVPERRSELDFIAKALDGVAIVDLARCAKDEGTLLEVSAIGGAGVAPTR